MSSEYVLEMKGIGKEYFGNRVLNNIDIHVRPGEILALVGENGAGKSTLMNILFGMPVIHSTGGFEGEIRIHGEPVNISNPFEAMKMGIGMVHQEFMLIDGYDVAENIKLNRENVKKGPFGGRLALLDRAAMRRDAEKTLDDLGIGLAADASVGGLPVGHKQFVEIARELDKKNIQLIVLDEPTAVLTEEEAHQFLECVRSVARQGIAFIFISHRLKEIKNYADRISILRDGALVGEYDAADISIVRISELMVGRPVDIQRSERAQENHGDSVIRLKNFSVDMPGEALHNVNLDIKRGEILGIGGLAGHGKAALANGVIGLYPTEGCVELEGEEIDTANTLDTLKKGIMYVSEDRRGVGLMLDSSIEQNITVASMRVFNHFTKRVGPLKFYAHKEGEKYAQQMIEKFDIRCTGPAQPVRRLSGGNQQKVCIARAISMNPKTLFVSEPTRGIDIGAKKKILDSLVEMNREQGMTIIITSSELAELRAVCDRIVIVTEGKIAGILKPDAKDYQFGLLMSGSRLEEEEGKSR